MNLENIPVQNKARDKAWEAFIKRKDVKAYFGEKDDAFKFPLERGWYELWCQCWEKAWQQGWDDAYDAGRLAERERLQAFMRQMFDAYALSSDPGGLKNRGST